jgi:prepilin-type N-terminal cleavage/methylation domain-containing protein
MVAMKIIKLNKGFTIIELMVAVAIIAILAAITIPNYLGMQGRAKRRVLKEIASSAKTELHHWIEATITGEKGVLDIDGNGVASADEFRTDMTNIPDAWVQAFAGKIGHTPASPFNKKLPLFFIGPIDPPRPGQIVLSTINNGKGIRIVAYDDHGVSLVDSVSVEQ